MLRILKALPTMPDGAKITVLICILVIVISIRSVMDTPARQRKRWIRDFVAKTPPEQLYPTTLFGFGQEKVSTSIDKIADMLEIDAHEAYKLLHGELSRRKLPHQTPPELQEKVDLRIKQDLERWKTQIHEYVDAVPPEDWKDARKESDHRKEICRRFGVPSRIVRTLIWEDSYARTKECQRKEEWRR